MKNLFIGIDISKEVFDYCAIDEQNQIIINKQVAPNSKDGIEKFCQKLDQLKSILSGLPWNTLGIMEVYYAMSSLFVNFVIP
ncbi:IS110 family transposase [Cloacibacterium normanense]